MPVDDGSEGEGSAAEEMVARIIDHASIPGRHGEPRLAEHLTDVETTHVDTDHGRVAAWRVGSGPAVLLVHGWRDSARLWDPLMSRLAAKAKPFVAFDLPGHGFSEGERCLTAEVPDAVTAVAEALGPVDAAVAHSFASGGTALAVAEGLELDRLVLIAPPLAYRSPGESAGDARTAGLQRWRRIATELGFDAELGEVALERYQRGLGPSRGGWDLTGGLQTLPTEVLLLASVDDERFDVASARALAADLPRCRLVELTGSDHRGSARDGAALDAIVAHVAAD